MHLGRRLLLLACTLAACDPDGPPAADVAPAPAAPAGAAPADPAASGARALARTGRRSRGSNSQLTIPQGLTLADVDGDGTSDFVQVQGNDVGVLGTSFEQPPLLHLFLGRPAKRMLTGDFHGDGRDQVCAVTDDNGISCYGISTDHHELWWWFTQGSIVGDNEDSIVGDFDGDGRDDVLVYPRGGGAYRMYSIKDDAFFAATPAFQPGNLGTAAAGLQLRAADTNGDGRDDLVIVNAAGQVLSYVSVWDGSSHTFWWAFTSVGGFVGADDQVTVARIDDDRNDDLVLRARTSGATRFHRVDYGDGRPPAITNVAIGQLDTAGNRLVFWGALHGSVAEPGARTRDDALVYDRGSAMFTRSDARWDGSQLTYWWAYTQNAPGTGPVDTSARVGGTSSLVKAYTEHLGRLTGAPPNDFGGNLGIVGTDLGVSYETPRGLAFLFGDSWTVVPGVRQDEDSYGTTSATAVARLAMPLISWARAASGAFRGFAVPGVNLGGMNVPTEGLTLGNTHYVFFTSGWNGNRHTHSVLAHFDGSDPTAMIKDHDVVSDKFINISAVNEGNMIYLYGNGLYRRSPLYLARVEPWNLADRSRWTYFRGMRRGEPVFGPGESTAVELVNQPCFGEISVRKHPARPLYLMTYNCDAPRGILLRTAATPTGPWTDPQVIFDPGASGGGYQHIMHANEAVVGHDDGLAEPYGGSTRRTEWGGEYGPYLVPRWFRSEPNGAERIVYTMSTWNPYQIHLMETVLVPPGTSVAPPVRGEGLPRATLANGDFGTRDLRGWTTVGDGATFPIFTGSDGRPRLTTYTPARGDAATGAVYQDFTVDASTSELRFKLHGGDGGSIKLFRGGELLRRSIGRQNNDVETEVIWQLHEYSGDTLRLVIEDYSTAPWGFIGVSGFELR